MLYKQTIFNNQPHRPQLIHRQQYLKTQVTRMQFHQNPHNHIPNHKSHQLRLQIRNKQVQQYKQKIRSMYCHNLHAPSIKQNRQPVGFHQDMFQEHGLDMRLCTLGHVSNWGREVVGIAVQLGNLANRLNYQGAVLKEITEGEFATEQLRREYQQKLDLLINILVRVEQDSELSGSQYRQQMLQILQITTENSPKTQLWKIQQRCLISYMYQKYLCFVLKTKSYPIATLHQLQICVKYLANLLISQENNNGVQRGLLNFNQIQEEVFQQVVEVYNEMMLGLSIQEDDQRYDEFVRTGGLLLDQILKVASQYFRLYVKQMQHDRCCNEDDKQIGSIRLQVIKSLINLSVANLLLRIQLPHQSYPQLQTSINSIIQLCSNFSIIISYYPVEQLRMLEDSTSQHQFDTLVGFLVRLCEVVVDVGECIVQRGMEGVGGYWTGELWLGGVDNGLLVGCIARILEKDIYVGQYVRALYNQSNLAIYLLTCIFTQASSPRPTPQLQCLKLINLLFNRYGIMVDEQRNLQLRYLRNIGNGDVNVYYFQHLAKIGRTC